MSKQRVRWERFKFVLTGHWSNAVVDRESDARLRLAHKHRFVEQHGCRQCAEVRFHDEHTDDRWLQCECGATLPWGTGLTRDLHVGGKWEEV